MWALRLDGAMEGSSECAVRSYPQPRCRAPRDRDAINTTDLPGMLAPESWLKFLGLSDMNQLQRVWKKDGKQLMNPTKLRSIVVKIYQAKMEADGNNLRAGKARFPIVDYTVMYFDTFFGLKQ
ncbi:hypothetical protein CYMTET_36394, partial [Cymbomonas tetramitiformis]